LGIASKLNVGLVLFDLDGTLVDTAPDFVGALSALSIEEDNGEIDYECARGLVSDGSLAMLRMAFRERLEALGSTQSQPYLDALRPRLLSMYERNIADESRLFAGMDEVLDQLEAREIPWGVVTNKPGFLTDKLLDALNLSARAACIVSGDTLAHAKPHPLPVLHACDSVACEPAQAIMLGDSHRDVDAGRAAGSFTMVAQYGYIPIDQDARHWRADAYIDSPLDLLTWLR
jgi:phosphoglycolate phosphatase